MTHEAPTETHADPADDGEELLERTNPDLARWSPDQNPQRSPFFFTWTAQAKAKPLALTGGEGAWYTTADGQRWLDFGSLIYQATLGHGNTRMVEAIQRQAGELCLASPNAVFPAKVALAERLLSLAPSGFSKVFFTLGGAEAIENAVKMARWATGRYKVISRYRSYHGASFGAISLTGDYRRPPAEPALIGAIHALDCYCDRCPFGQVVTHCRRECASHIADLLDLEGRASVAAVVLEPIPAANGVLVPPPGYWQRVREACDVHGTLLIADEVTTGFGRTGRWFGIDHEGVTPDLMTLGKGLTAGYGTLGAVLVHERVARIFDERTLYAGLTGYAHPLACAAGLEALSIYEDNGLVERAAALEGPLLAGLAAIRSRFPQAVRAVRGRGLLACLELTVDGSALALLSKALERRHAHVHIRAAEGNLILAPPLCIADEELDLGVRLVAEALGEVLEAPRQRETAESGS